MPQKDTKNHFSKMFQSKPRQYWKRAHRGAKELIINPSSEQAVRTGKARKLWYSNLIESRPLSSYNSFFFVYFFL